MLGAGLQFNRTRNGQARFYSGARARLTQEVLRRVQSDVTSGRSRSRPDEQQPENSKPEVPLSLQATELSPLCNLERFLESVTPSVPAQFLSKMKLRTWRTSDMDFQPFFVLSDLWESFREWSAYGVGVPLILNDRDGVIQYYVPYLSAIQLYADPSKSMKKLRHLGEESDGEYFRDSCSDGSSDSEQERGALNYSREQLNYIQTNDLSLRVNHLSLKERHMAFQDGFSSDDGESGGSRGCLLFEYFEREQPYSREPLANKISDLALRFPELKTFRSCDLLPSSWISVAWYPIYRIPTGSTLTDMGACFLTYHYLHTPLKGSEVHSPTVMGPTGSDGVPQIPLPVFGLAWYKYKVQLWTPHTERQRQLASSLFRAADNWLNMLQANHPDFSFFCRR